MGIASVAGAAVNIDYVPVGNPGNAGDVQSQGTFGTVAAAYAIGRTEVTNNQYAEFLNAKAADDPLDLYDLAMGSEASGGINRSGVPGSYSYAVKPGQGNNPVVLVSWFDSVRFANWLHNGQGTGSTETGAYTLTGGTPTPSNGNTVTRNGGATVFLPTENEWYKAAYYDPAKAGGAGYWDYPTRTDAAPYSDQPPGTDAPTPGNTGNFRKDDGVANGYNDGYAVTGSPSTPSGNALTDVGAYPSALSAYGTLDQGGNVFEWSESFLTSGPARTFRGGSFGSDESNLAASFRTASVPDMYGLGLGFRVASVPEPANMAVVSAAGMALLRRRRAKGPSAVVPV